MKVNIDLVRKYLRDIGFEERICPACGKTHGKDIVIGSSTIDMASDKGYVQIVFVKCKNCEHIDMFDHNSIIKKR